MAWKAILMFGKFDAVFFDVDGTLVHLFEEHAESYRQAFQSVFNSPAPTRKYFLGLFNRGSEREVFVSALEDQGVRVSEQLLRKLTKTRSGIFSRLIRDASSKNVIPGAKERLALLRSQGKNVYCISGNTRKMAEPILGKTGLLSFFDGTFFIGDSPALASKTAILLHAMKAKRIPRNKVCFVGDTPGDIEAGKKAGVGVVAVSTGVVPFAVLKKSGHGRVVRSLSVRKRTSAPRKKAHVRK